MRKQLLHGVQKQLRTKRNQVVFITNVFVYDFRILFLIALTMALISEVHSRSGQCCNHFSFQENTICRREEFTYYSSRTICSLDESFSEEHHVVNCDFDFSLISSIIFNEIVVNRNEWGKMSAGNFKLPLCGLSRDKICRKRNLSYQVVYLFAISRIFEFSSRLSKAALVSAQCCYSK